MLLVCEFTALTLILGFCIVVMDAEQILAQVARFSRAHCVLFILIHVFSSKWLME